MGKNEIGIGLKIRTSSQKTNLKNRTSNTSLNQSLVCPGLEAWISAAFLGFKVTNMKIAVLFW